ncbi:hypothetical protein L9F63_020352, partial [Diploptera punctata]
YHKPVKAFKDTIVYAAVETMAKEKYLTEEELVNILYSDDSSDDLIPELEDSQSESEDELPLPEIDTTLERMYTVYK